mgnify:CR=1 FL=1
MEPVIAKNSTAALNGLILSSQLTLKSSKTKLDIIAVTDAKQCVDPTKAYAIMKAPRKSCIELSLKHNNEEIGFADITGYASYLERIDNFCPDQYAGTGTALVELTARLAIKSGYTSVNLYSVNDATQFHFKMGSRFDNLESDQAIKDFIAGRKKDEHKIFGDMQLDLAKSSTGPESPHLMHTILKDDVETLQLTLQHNAN